MKVGIAKNSGSIFESVVYRELERQAVKKGFFKVEPGMVKQASEKKPVSPSGDLTLDIGILTAELRKKGFEKHANELEKKFVLYKQAETHMYRVHDEDGEDLIQFAHRDGDVDIVPVGSDGLGHVETILSAAKKILEVVNKEPTGKQGSAKEGLTKKAQDVAETTEAQLVESEFTKLDKYKDLGFTAEEIGRIRFTNFNEPEMNLYSKLANVNVADIKKYYGILDAMGLANIGQVTDWNVKSWATKASKETVNWVEAQLGLPQSGIIEQYIGEASAIIQSFTALHQRVWGSFDKVQSGLRALYDAVNAELAAIDTSPASIIDGDSVKEAGIKPLLSKIVATFKKVQTGNNSKQLFSVIKVLAPDLQEKYNAFWPGISTEIAGINTTLANSVFGVYGLLTGPINEWKSNIERFTGNSRKIAEANIKALERLQGVLRMHRGKPFSRLKIALAKLASDFSEPSLNVGDIGQLRAAIAKIIEDSGNMLSSVGA